MTYNFKPVFGGSSYRAWKQWASGDFLVGSYVSQKADNYGNPSYKVEVIEAKFADGTAPKAGAFFSFNSSGSLNKVMEEVNEGDAIKVIYKGTEVVSKGKFKGKPYHAMEVLVSRKDGSEVKTIAEDDSDELI